jgi:hypothetical protein
MYIIKLENEYIIIVNYVYIEINNSYKEKHFQK